MVERLTPALRAEADALAAALAEVREIRGLQGQATGELEAGLATRRGPGELAAAMAAAAPIPARGPCLETDDDGPRQRVADQLAAALAGAPEAPPAPAAAGGRCSGRSRAS